MNSEIRFEYRHGNKATTNALAYDKFRVVNAVRIATNPGVLYETDEKVEPLCD